MRTTINLDDDVLRAVRSLAGERSESLSRLPTLAIHNGGCLATFDRRVADLTPESTAAAVESMP